MIYTEDKINIAIDFFWENIGIDKNVIGLSGNLGAGKTTFVKALLKSMGVEQNVVSPTFVLRRDYEASPPSPLLQRGEEVQSFLTGNKKNIDSLKKISRELRSGQTEAEEILWECLRNSKLGYKFRRQHVVGSFVADFICLPQKLIIELDGEIHDFQKEKDNERTNILNNLGFQVLRFSNRQLINDLDFVINSILVALAPFSEGEGLGMRPFTRIIHIDAYRLENPEHIYQVVSKEELENKNNLILIEWPELADRNILDQTFLFEHISDTERKIGLVV